MLNNNLKYVAPDTRRVSKDKAALAARRPVDPTPPPPLSLSQVDLAVQEKEQFVNVTRWFDHVQHYPGVRHHLPLITVLRNRIYPSRHHWCWTEKSLKLYTMFLFWLTQINFLLIIEPLEKAKCVTAPSHGRFFKHYKANLLELPTSKLRVQFLPFFFFPPAAFSHFTGQLTFVLTSSPPVL